MYLSVAKKKPPQPTPFGQKLKELRQAAGLTQAALAETVGMNRLVLGRLETSPDANPTLDTIHKLAVALKCSTADLIGEPD